MDEALAVAGQPLRDVPFPDGSAVVMVIRGRELVAPRGDTVLTPGDHVYVAARPAELPLLHLIFGRPEEE